MDPSLPFSSMSSLFESLKCREVRPTTVKERPCMENMTSDGACSGSGVLAVEPNGVSAPPLAISFGKTVQASHLLAVADEEGFVSIFNSCSKLPSSNSSRIKTGDIRNELWLAHCNAIFDICWVREDAQMLTASGDQTIRLWDIEARTRLGSMRGHNGSVKTLCGHPYQPDTFASGSRDGNVALWDMRSGATQNTGAERFIMPVSLLTGAHTVTKSRRGRGSKSKSVTAVLYLKDDRILVTAGAADGVVKFWDTRKLTSPISQSPQEPQPLTEDKDRRSYGIAGLSQHPSGAYLIASCTDNRIYAYNVLRPERGPSASFSGHVQGSFYIKASFSPDGTHILSGSSDGDVFIWKMDKPESSPVRLKGHEGEVTAIAWCPADLCKFATCSDDFTVRIWSNLEPKFEKFRCSSSVLRRRVCAQPQDEAMMLEAHMEPLQKDKDCGGAKGEGESATSPKPMQRSATEPASSSHGSDHDYSPLAAFMTTSPSSVLNVPSSSKKRKIMTDYFQKTQSLLPLSLKSLEKLKAPLNYG